MNLETIYYVGQSIAVIAILASLAFVGYQTRQTNRFARTELTRALLAETREFADSISTSPEMSAFMFEAQRAKEPLPPERFYRLAMYYASWFTAVESAFKINEEGLMEPSVYEHIRGTTRTMDCVNLRSWREHARPYHPRDFADDVDASFAMWDRERAKSEVVALKPKAPP